MDQSIDGQNGVEGCFLHLDCNRNLAMRALFSKTRRNGYCLSFGTVNLGNDMQQFKGDEHGAKAKADSMIQAHQELQQKKPD